MKYNTFFLVISVLLLSCAPRKTSFKLEYSFAGEIFSDNIYLIDENKNSIVVFKTNQNGASFKDAYVHNNIAYINIFGADYNLEIKRNKLSILDINNKKVVTTKLSKGFSKAINFKRDEGSVIKYLEKKLNTKFFED